MAEGEARESVTGLASIVIAAATLVRPVGACPPPADVEIEVVVRLDPLRVVSDIGLADMEELRRRSGQQERHRTLGFNSNVLVTRIEPHQVVASPADCERSIRATVGLWLTERRIHIAREAATLPCLSAVAVSHLTHHATAEGEAFGRMVGRVEEHLQSAAFSAMVRAERAREGDVDMLIKAALDRELVTYDAARKQVREETDTADEIERVQNACS